LWRPFWKFWQRRIAPLMVTYHYVKIYVSIIIHLEVININVRNFNFPTGLYSNPTPFEPLKIWLWPSLPQSCQLEDQLETYIYNSTKFHEFLSSSSWNLPRTRSCRTKEKRLIIIITLTAIVIYKIYMQFIKNIYIYLIEIIIIHLNIILCFWTLVLCSGLTFEVPVKVRPVKIFILYRFKKKIDICIKIKLFLHTFQIYNHLLTKIIIKRIIWHQRREHW
jgi:hypothetical protein